MVLIVRPDRSPNLPQRCGNPTHSAAQIRSWNPLAVASLSWIAGVFASREEAATSPMADADLKMMLRWRAFPLDGQGQ
jgi:hypothetical protein